MKIIYLISLIMILTSCNKNKSFQSLKENLVGAWQMDIDDGILREEWKFYEGKLMGTTSMLDKTGDKRENEKMNIFIENDAMFYEALVHGHNDGKGIRFQLTKYSEADHSYLFENSTHDFPTKIFYQFKSNLELYAYVSGNIEGKESKLEFNYRRSK